MKPCPKCKKEVESYSIITGKCYPCGHQYLSLTKKEKQKRKTLLKGVNQVGNQILVKDSMKHE